MTSVRPSRDTLPRHHPPLPLIFLTHVLSLLFPPTHFTVNAQRAITCSLAGCRRGFRLSLPYRFFEAFV